MATDGALSRLRQPEYTGENRCTPCTVVNVGIAVVVSTVLGLAVPVLGPLALGVSLAAIYLRGYLVPGTPTLTERYFPDRVLRRFDEAPDRGDATLIGTPDDGDGIDPEPILLDAGVLEPTPDGSDLRLTDGFRSEWTERIEALDEGDYASRLVELLVTEDPVDPDALEFDVADWGTTVSREGVPIARWVSEAALVADLAATPSLRERIGRWDGMAVDVRGQLLHSTRLFLEQCPQCGGELVLSEGTVESCCLSVPVVTLACVACDVVVLEVEV